MNQGIFSPLSLVALESIDFQVKDKTVKELEIIFEDIMTFKEQGNEITVEKLKPFKDLIQSKLRKRFNLNKLEFAFIDTPEINAYALPPDVTSSSQMVKTFTNKAQMAIHGRLALDKVDSVEGSVDFKTGRVTGDLSEFPAAVGLSLGALNSGLFKPIHFVAFIMHEIGHIITYFETLNFTFSTCFILADTLAKLDKSKSIEERIKIVKGIESKTGIDISNKDIITDSDDNSTTVINIFKDIAESKNSEFGSSIYDMRSWESLSDQFAARMGLTIPLAEANDILSRAVLKDHGSYRSNFTFWITSVLRWITVIITTVISPVIGGFFIILELFALILSPFERIYDKPGERIQRLRNELNAEAKNPNLDIDQRKRIVEDIKIIDAIAQRINDKEDYVEKVWLLFSSDARDQKKRRLLLQDLQALTNNDLFASANVLKILKG